MQVIRAQTSILKVTKSHWVKEKDGKMITVERWMAQEFRMRRNRKRSMRKCRNRRGAVRCGGAVRRCSGYGGAVRYIGVVQW